MKRPILLVAALLLLIANIAAASWYDDYEAGIAAVRKGQWQVVIQKMTAAIAGNSKENNAARSYGNIFINYHPFYYRGLAYLKTGKYEQAIADFEQTTGPGEVDRGSIEELMADAKSRHAAGTTTTTEPPVPIPVPVVPAMDPALRQQVNNAINAANQSLTAARGRNANSSAEYQRALTTLADANQRTANARNNDDLQQALALANNAKLFADSAVAPVIPTPMPTTPGPIVPTTTTATRPGAATSIVLGETTRRVRHALESYFNGDFEDATTEFQRLSQEMPRNGWIWAFLGASQYSRYAFEADESHRAAAILSFRKAKQLRSWKGGLPQKYFSKRIRTAFERG